MEARSTLHWIRSTVTMSKTLRSPGVGKLTTSVQHLSIISKPHHLWRTGSCILLPGLAVPWQRSTGKPVRRYGLTVTMKKKERLQFRGKTREGEWLIGFLQIATRIVSFTLHPDFF